MSDWNWPVIIGVAILVALLSILEQLKVLNRRMDHSGTLGRHVDGMREEMKTIATDVSSLQKIVADIAIRAAERFPTSKEAERDRYGP